MTAYENFYTGGLEYIIRYRKGTYVILRESSNDEYEEIFQGHYDECKTEMQMIIVGNYEYDLGI